MHRSLSIACLMVTGLAASAHAQVIADSIADFSGTQGQNGWFYGAFTESDGFSTFHLMPEFDGARWWLDSDRYWTMVGPVGAHPNGRITSGFAEREEHWAVRRWVSPIAGLVEVAADLGKINISPDGNGVTGIIFVDGIEVWRDTLGATDAMGVQPTLELSIAPGTIIDFALDPNGSNDWSDNARFSAVIQMVPAPGAAALLALAGIASCRRRRG